MARGTIKVPVYATGPRKVDSRLSGRRAVSVDYDSQSCCYGGKKSDGSYCCDGYGRNSTLSNVRVTEVSLKSLAVEMTRRQLPNDPKRPGLVKFTVASGTPIEVYVIERVLAAYKAWDASNWDVRVSGGYYGQEVDEITWWMPNDLVKRLEEVLALADDSAKAELALRTEYALILPEASGKTWTLETVKLADITLDNWTGMVKANHEAVPDDENIEHQIAGSLINEGDKFTLIDGRQRYSALASRGIKEAPYLVAR